MSFGYSRTATISSMSMLRLRAGTRGSGFLLRPRSASTTMRLPLQLYSTRTSVMPLTATRTGFVACGQRAPLAANVGDFRCSLARHGRFYGTENSPSSKASALREFLKGFGWVVVGILITSEVERRSRSAKSSSSYLNDDTHADDLNLDLAPGPSEEEITKILEVEAFAHAPAGAGVQRYHGTRVASNGPVEDQFIHSKFPATADGDAWFAWGVYDGHAGSQTGELLKRKLLPFVRNALNRLSPTSSDETVQGAIKDAFLALDHVIIQGAVDAARSDVPFQDMVGKAALGAAGSCALLSLFDPKTRILRVACTGDSRAVLGQQGADGEWTATPLSVDQSGTNEDEIARINAEHPGEEGIVKDGRVLGIMCSRAFGDGRWKWDLEFQKELQRKFGVVKPLSPDKYAIKTPPYLTAEPVVTSTKIDPERPSFMILATDGLWDMLSNEQAVKLVADWLDWQAVDASKRTKSTRDNTRYDLERHAWQKPEWEFKEERTALRDDNVAVHLVRNALGGRFHEMISGNLALGPPFVRHVKDDITVQVVFFDGKAPRTKEIVVR